MRALFFWNLVTSDCKNHQVYHNKTVIIKLYIINFKRFSFSSSFVFFSLFLIIMCIYMRLDFFIYKAFKLKRERESFFVIICYYCCCFAVLLFFSRLIIMQITYTTGRISYILCNFKKLKKNFSNMIFYSFGIKIINIYRTQYWYWYIDIIENEITIEFGLEIAPIQPTVKSNRFEFFHFIST